jgi:hypothetical protein
MSPAERALAFVRGLAPSPAPAGVLDGAVITVNFHPDRLLSDGRTVADCLVAEKVYRSQFETGISNGGLGGQRAVWEERMFSGAYRATAGRPVYGGLNLAGFPDGASPRFGSCHLVLRPVVSARATFSHGDSVTEPQVVGTASSFGAVWAALLDEVARTGRALNLAAGSPAEWVAALPAPRTAAGRALDDYVEAQVHGGLALGADVAAVVVDPSFRGTRFAPLLRTVGAVFRWSPGFRLPAADFPADLRGPSVPPLAREIADRYGVEVLDAAVIGRAARERGNTPERLQLIKYLWHVLVLLGAPVSLDSGS